MVVSRVVVTVSITVTVNVLGLFVTDIGTVDLAYVRVSDNFRVALSVRTPVPTGSGVASPLTIAAAASASPCNYWRRVPRAVVRGTGGPATL